MGEVAHFKNPFVGPKPLSRDDQFHGREEEQAKLFQLLDARRIVLLHAPSGAGKTSLIQAGLIPQLEEDEFHVLPIARLHYLPTASAPLGEDFNRYVYSFILTLEEKQSDSEEDLRNEALETPSILTYFRNRLESMDRWSPVVLIVDQFEEILKDPIDLDKKETFFIQLGRALHELDIWALFVIRDDYMGPLMDIKYVRHIPTRLVNTFHLDLLGKEAAVRAIKRTAEGCEIPLDEAGENRGGRQFNDKAVAKLVDNLRQIKVQLADGSLENELGPNVEPVHLQVVCHRLWEKLPLATTEITIAELDAYGDVDQSLALFYADEIGKVAAKSGVEERYIRFWVQNRLITHNGIRLPVLQEGEQTRGLDNPVIEELVDRHLLRKETRGGRIFYELSHDRMVQPVLENNEAWFEQHLSILQRRAEEWKSRGHQDYLLLSGDDFLVGQAWVKDHKEEMSTLDNKYYEASKQIFDEEEELRQAQENELALAKRVARLTRLIGCLVSLVLLAVIVFVAWAGYSAYQNAERAALNAESQVQVAQAQGTAVAGEGTASAGEATVAALNLEVVRAQGTADANYVAAQVTTDVSLSNPEAAMLEANATAASANVNATFTAATAEANVIQAQATAGLAQATAVVRQAPLEWQRATSDASVAIQAAETATQSADYARATVDVANATAAAAATNAAILESNCISANRWTPNNDILLDKDSNSCWDLSPWGIEMQDGDFNFNMDLSSSIGTNGIFAKVDGDATIEFEISVDKLTVPNNDVLTNLSFGIRSTDLVQEAGQIIYQQESSDVGYPVLLKHEELGDFDAYMTEDGAFIRYPLGAVDKISIRLLDNTLTIFRNGFQVAGPLGIDFDDRVFYLGYRLPVGGEIEATVSDLVIQEPGT